MGYQYASSSDSGAISLARVTYSSADPLYVASQRSYPQRTLEEALRNGGVDGFRALMGRFWENLAFVRLPDFWTLSLRKIGLLALRGYDLDPRQLN